MKIGQGFFIVFEGLDQSGKKTLSSWLSANLSERGISVRRYMFPNYEGAIGGLIKLYLDGRMALSVQARHLLFAADRWQLREEMVSLIQSGTVVIADRYSSSGIAYGLAHNLDFEWLEGLEKGLPQPDITFFIDIPPGASFARKPEQRDLYELQLDLLNRVREAYMRLAKLYKWTVFDGLEKPTDLQTAIIEKLFGNQ